jgi:hypothetical protein
VVVYLAVRSVDGAGVTWRMAPAIAGGGIAFGHLPGTIDEFERFLAGPANVGWQPSGW